MKRQLILLGLPIILSVPSFEQQADTITITASNISTSTLIPGTQGYLVYMKMGKDSSRTQFQYWLRTISFLQYNNRDAIAITQEWENNDTIIHKSYSVVDKNDFRTLYHETIWPKRAMLKFDFLKGEASVNGVDAKTRTDSGNVKLYSAFEQASHQYFLNWHLDLEVFPLLPYKNGAVFKINFYDPGFGPPGYVYYMVAGSDSLTGYDNQKIDCWLLHHKSPPGQFQYEETFWVSKKTKEVLKMEQEFGGHYRYKIKLGFGG